MSYTVGGDTYQVNHHVPPSTDCPTCHAVVTVIDDACYACGETFTGHELWDRYARHR